MKRVLLILLAVAGFLGCCAIDAETEDATPTYTSVPSGVELVSGGEVAAFHVLSNPGAGCDPPHEGDCPGAEWATEGTLVFSTKPTYPETCYLYQEGGYVMATAVWIDSQTMTLKPAEGVDLVVTEEGVVLRGLGR